MDNDSGAIKNMRIGRMIGLAPEDVRSADITSSVRLISITPDAEKTILYIARASSNQENTDPGLLRFLIKNEHWSPFEHGFMTIEIVTSRGIAQQILRHRSFSFQEFSQRYASPERAIVYPGRQQAQKNRQSSTDDLDFETWKWWREIQEEAHRFSFRAYQEAIERGVARECARFVLPIATETKLYMSGTVRSWIHYLERRADEHTQLEHREIAVAVQGIFADNLPVTAEALGWK